MQRSSGKVLKKRPGFWISGCLTQEGCPSSPLASTTFWLCHLLKNINIFLQNQFEDASPSLEGARLSWCPSRSPRTYSTPPPCCRRRTRCTPRRRWSRCRRWRGGARCRVCTTSAGRRGRVWSSRGTNKHLERILKENQICVAFNTCVLGAGHNACEGENLALVDGAGLRSALDYHFSTSLTLGLPCRPL